MNFAYLLKLRLYGSFHTISKRNLIKLSGLEEQIRLTYLDFGSRIDPCRKFFTDYVPQGAKATLITSLLGAFKHSVV